MSPGVFIFVAVAVIAGCLALAGWVQHRDGPVDDQGGVPTVHRMAGRARVVFVGVGVAGLVAGLVLRDGKVIAAGLLSLLAAWGQPWVHGLTER